MSVEASARLEGDAKMAGVDERLKPVVLKN
jgi:hypothetical protein